jgi:transposase
MDEQTPSTYTVRLAPVIEASGLPFSQEDRDKPPKTIQAFEVSTMTRLGEPGRKIDQIASKLNQDSINSSRPPSSDGPYKRKPKDKKKRKPGGQPGQ